MSVQISFLQGNTLQFDTQGRNFYSIFLNQQQHRGIFISPNRVGILFLSYIAALQDRGEKKHIIHITIYEIIYLDS